jgi:hypothetical protein
MPTSYRRAHILYCDLPGLRPGSVIPTASDPALVDVDHWMRDIVVEARAKRNDHLNNHEEARLSRTVREKLGDMITDRIMLFCQALDDDDLPRLYHEYEWMACTPGMYE